MYSRIFFFAQACNAFAVDVTLINNLVNQKRYSELGRVKEKIESKVLSRWVEYEILNHSIKKDPLSDPLGEKIYDFIADYPKHQMASQLAEAYIHELSKITKDSDILKRHALNLKKHATDTVTSFQLDVFFGTFVPLSSDNFACPSSNCFFIRLVHS